MVKIGAHLRKLSQKLNRGTVFLDHPVDCSAVICCMKAQYANLRPLNKFDLYNSETTELTPYAIL